MRPLTFTEEQVEQLESIRDCLHAECSQPSPGRLSELYQRFEILLREVREEQDHEQEQGIA